MPLPALASGESARTRPANAKPTTREPETSAEDATTLLLPKAPVSVRCVHANGRGSCTATGAGAGPGRVSDMPGATPPVQRWSR